jgi:hypothetical protein
MKKFFAVLTVLTVALGSLSLVPANAAYLSSSTGYEGGSNN